MVKIINLSKIRIMDFFLVMSNIKEYIEKEDTENLKLKDFYEQNFLPSFQKFDISLIPIRQKELTNDIHSLDKRRTTYFNGFNAHLRALKLFPDKNVVEAATRLKNIIDKFGKNITRLPLAEETAVHINILKEFDEAKSKSDISITGVKKWIDEIRKINEELHTLFKERINKEATIETGKSKSSRDSMQKSFTELCNRINALALIEGEASYRTLIDNINREIERAMQIRKQRAGLSKNFNEENLTNSLPKNNL